MMTLTDEQLQALSGHTPGPWVYSCGAVYCDEPRGDDGYPLIRLIEADRDNAATTPTERDANCKLSAAAPDLLAEVKRLNAVIEGNYSAYFRAHSQRDKLVCVLEGILKSAGYTKGEALPQLLELNVGRTYLDDARAALKEVTQ